MSPKRSQRKSKRRTRVANKRRTNRVRGRRRRASSTRISRRMTVHASWPRPVADSNGQQLGIGKRFRTALLVAICCCWGLLALCPKYGQKEVTTVASVAHQACARSSRNLFYRRILRWVRSDRLSSRFLTLSHLFCPTGTIELFAADASSGGVR